MSHVSAIKLRIKALDALRQSANELGMEMVEVDRFKWYGTHVGDYPLPEGFTKEEMGRCVYALRIKGNDKAYEVGVVKSKVHQGEYELMWDFWQDGFGLKEAIGEDGNKLKQKYSEIVATKQLRKMGLRVTRSITADNKVVLRGRG